MKSKENEKSLKQGKRSLPSDTRNINCDRTAFHIPSRRVCERQDKECIGGRQEGRKEGGANMKLATKNNRQGGGLHDGSRKQ